MLILLFKVEYRVRKVKFIKTKKMGFVVAKFTFIHLADAFIQSDLKLVLMSEFARLWSN